MLQKRSITIITFSRFQPTTVLYSFQPFLFSRHPPMSINNPPCLQTTLYVFKQFFLSQTTLSVQITLCIVKQSSVSPDNPMYPQTTHSVPRQPSVSSNKLQCLQTTRSVSRFNPLYRQTTFSVSRQPSVSSHSSQCLQTTLCIITQLSVSSDNHLCLHKVLKILSGERRLCSRVSDFLIARI